MDEKVQRQIVQQLIALKPKSKAEVSEWLAKIESDVANRVEQLNQSTTMLQRFNAEVRLDTKSTRKRIANDASRSIAAMVGKPWRQLTSNSCRGGVRDLRARNWPLRGIDGTAEHPESQIVLLWSQLVRSEKFSKESRVDLPLCKGAASFLNQYCLDNPANAELLDLREMRAHVPQTNALREQKKVWIGPSKPGDDGWVWDGKAPAKDRPSIRADAADDLCTFFLCNEVAHVFDKRYWILVGPGQAVVIVRSAQPVHWSRPGWAR